MANEPDYEQRAQDIREARSFTVEQHEDRYERWLEGENR